MIDYNVNLYYVDDTSHYIAVGTDRVTKNIVALASGYFDKVLKDNIVIGAVVGRDIVEGANMIKTVISQIAPNATHVILPLDLQVKYRAFLQDNYRVVLKSNHHITNEHIQWVLQQLTQKYNDK